MKHRIIFISIIFSTVLFLVNFTQDDDFPVLKGPYLGQKPPGMNAEIFAPGIVSTSDNEALYGFFKDGTFVLFDRTSPKHRPLATRILDCLDVSGLPEYERMEAAGEVAACLKEILDRVPLSIEKAPDIKAIEAAGGVEKLSRWQIPHTRMTIARVEKGPRRHEYLFTPGTVERAVEYYEDVKSLKVRKTGPKVSEGFYRWYISAPGHPRVAAFVDRLPDWARRRVCGQSIWRWVGLLVSLVVTILVMWVAYKLYGRLGWRFHGEAPVRYCLTILLPIVAGLVFGAHTIDTEQTFTVAPYLTSHSEDTSRTEPPAIRIGFAFA